MESPPEGRRRRAMRHWWRALFLCSLFAVLTTSTRGLAWASNEHVRMSFMAVSAEALHTAPLDSASMEQLRWLWAAARETSAPRKARLCEAIDEDDLSRERFPSCISFAALPAFAGDHSCSAMDLGQGITAESGWQLTALRRAYRFDQRVKDIGASQVSASLRRAQIQNQRRDLDFSLIEIDQLYRSRAQDNKTHFQLPRGPMTSDLETYLRYALLPGVPANATALYVAYHVAALRHALAAANARATGAKEAGEEAFRAVLHEAYALHFLEDSFSAGHIVGGVSPLDPEGVRFGTHDYYCAHGYAMFTWGGSAYPGYGDGFATPKDYEHTALAVRESLRQLARALGAGNGVVDIEEQLAAFAAVPGDDPLNGCHAIVVPRGLAEGARLRLIQSVLSNEPWPAVTEPPPPTFTNEYGLFGLLMLSIDVGALLPTNRESEERPRFLGDLSVTTGIGYGMEGVSSSRRDALLFLGLTASGQTRGGVELLGAGPRFRLPFAYIPGDFFIWGPAAIVGSARRAEPWAVRMANQASQAVEYSFSETTEVRIELGREASLQFLLDPRSGAYRGWDFAIPFASFHGHRFDRDTASDDVFGLVVRIGRDPELGTFVGPSLSYSHAARQYRF